jgi:hypothetical protein
MTESEWLSCTDPDEIVRFLQAKASDRKLRLFACACVRVVWNYVVEERARLAVEVSERYADGRASDDELEEAFAYANRVVGPGRPGGLASWDAHDAARLAAHPLRRGLADSTACAAARAGAAGGEEYWKNYSIEQTNQCILLRDIFSNPFRPIVLNPTWRTANVLALAQAIYADRAFERMPILGDALEDAGCDNVEILNHCRQPGEHVRGCWVVDLILGKE